MTADAIGGVWTYATDLAAALVPHKVETVLALLGPTPDAARAGAARAIPGLRLVETGLPVDWLADGPDAVRAAGRAIAGLARDTSADLVHLNSPSLCAGCPMGVPVLAVDHGGIGPWWRAAHSEVPPETYAWLDALIGAGLAAADAVAAPSESYAATLAHHYRLRKRPVAIVNGRAPMPQTGGVAEAGVLTIGRLWDPVKNTALLDAVAARLPVRFAAAGPVAGPHGAAVAPRHLATTGVLGAADLAARLAARPVFVSAARFEPFGLAVLEAAQAGCPLVLSAIDTFRELWGGAALFVAGDDPAAWAAAIERLLADEAERSRMGDAARHRARRYTPDAMATATASLYARLLAPAERAAA